MTYAHIDDETVELMHVATEAHIKALRITWGISRQAALEHLVAFSENDPESPVFTTASGKARKRPRKMQAEAHV